MKVEADIISVSYGAKQALGQMQFDAQAGKMTIIIGPNGSGKTTLLRTLSGDLPYRGTITVNGSNIAKTKPAQMAMQRAILAQETLLSFPFTVAEIVRLGMSVSKEGLFAKSETKNRIEAALEKVDLRGFSGRFYQELSGGERQRVQLARVLCQIWEPVSEGTPRWLFLDEPVSSLDIKHQLLIMNIGADYAKRGGGVIAIMHDLNLTSMFADKIYAIHEGQIFASGAPSDVLNDRMLSQVYDCPLRFGFAPKSTLFVLPQSAG
ncbi:MAG: heme ABC transporter ATP-binding protein [Ahrensia sp.]|nr:heme ABC transporter ATP-binding protein [Ahrensia sp.]